MNEIFSFRTEDGRARCCILGAECLKAIYTALTTGVFLTGLLMSAGMDEAEVGIIFDWDNYWALEYTSGPSVFAWPWTCAAAAALSLALLWRPLGKEVLRC